MEPVERAQDLAITLAKQGVDANEVAGVFRRLRAYLDQSEAAGASAAQAIERWWQWLETIAGPGLTAVQRSNQTATYYHDILRTCRSYLRDLPASEMTTTLGWAVRLTRYYRMGGSPVGQSATPRSVAVLAPPSPPIDPAKKQVDDLLVRLSELPNQRVATEVSRFVTAWQSLEVDAELKRKVAQAIIDKVRLAGRERTSSERKWYQELAAFINSAE